MFGIRELDGGLGRLIVGHGDVSGEEYVDVMTRYLTSAPRALAAVRYTVCDYTGVTGSNITNTHLEAIIHSASMTGLINDNTLIGICAPGDLTYGLSRKWQAIADDLEWETYVGRSMEEVGTWLRQQIRKRHGIGDIPLQPGRWLLSSSPQVVNSHRPEIRRSRHAPTLP